MQKQYKLMIGLTIQILAASVLASGCGSKESSPPPVPVVATTTTTPYNTGYPYSGYGGTCVSATGAYGGTVYPTNGVCPAGYILSGTSGYGTGYGQTVYPTNGTCPAGYAIYGTQCVSATSNNCSVGAVYTASAGGCYQQGACPAGYVMYGTQCVMVTALNGGSYNPYGGYNPYQYANGGVYGYAYGGTGGYSPYGASACGYGHTYYPGYGCI